jgi:hypothetical protein
LTVTVAVAGCVEEAALAAPCAGTDEDATVAADEEATAGAEVVAAAAGAEEAPATVSRVQVQVPEKLMPRAEL